MQHRAYVNVQIWSQMFVRIYYWNMFPYYMFLYKPIFHVIRFSFVEVPFLPHWCYCYVKHTDTINTQKRHFTPQTLTWDNWYLAAVWDSNAVWVFLPRVELQRFRKWRKRKNKEAAHFLTSEVYLVATSLIFSYLKYKENIIKNSSSFQHKYNLHVFNGNVSFDKKKERFILLMWQSILNYLITQFKK